MSENHEGVLFGSTHTQDVRCVSRGGRPPDNARSEHPTVTNNTAAADSDAQQQLDAVTTQPLEDDTESGIDAQSADRGQETAARREQRADAELHASLEQAIDALQEIDNLL